jgi:hypothetical protein
MTFDSLLNIKMTEAEVFDRFAEVLQKNFAKYQGVAVAMMLSDIVDGKVSLTHLYFFEHTHDGDQRKIDILFTGSHSKCYVTTQFKNGFYDTVVFGHHTLKCGDVYPTELKHVHLSLREDDRAQQEMHDFKKWGELFGTIKKELIKKVS